MLAGAATGFGALVAGCLGSLGSDPLDDAEEGKGLVLDGELAEISFVSCDQDRFSVSSELPSSEQSYAFYVQPPGGNRDSHKLLLVNRDTDERYNTTLDEGEDFEFELDDYTTGEATLEQSSGGSGSIDVRWDLAC